ncbi:uncharacterized protein BT62DRAFT_150 [Guyanagaster necrorhizus]|uniref:Replication protein A C-terminal domain-containing protein n=1 Tax=Guyanagaster necrorhizus TaxID=856835 RepID=A0A9P7W5P6_9AGAR|nr:uncharacterized protein BT62DRAFT_150 [Guyanagaster necrorhizus MCA 3950]KAG7452415.1 hypothetical protein BT62DRAFT_150 [Guyanagaster necrorhizus MCA 3950]
MDKVAMNEGGHNNKGPRYDVKDSIRCITIAQAGKSERMHDAAPFKIDGKEIGQVAIVGNLLSYSLEANYTAYEIDDGTGKITACLWKSDASDVFVSDIDQETINNLQLIRVIGRLGRWQTKTTLSKILSIHKISDPHAVYCHLLQCATESLIYERGMPPSQETSVPPALRASAQPDDGIHVVTMSFAETSLSPSPKRKPRKKLPSKQPTPSPPDSPIEIHMIEHEIDEDIVMLEYPNRSSPTTPQKTPSTRNQATPSLLFSQDATTPTSSSKRRLRDHIHDSPSKTRPQNRDPYSDLNAIQRDIILFINEKAGNVSLYPAMDGNPHALAFEEGISRNTIINTLSHRRVPADAIRSAIEFLIARGYIYSTGDEEHFAVT